MKHNKENWKELLESLKFTEQKNNQFGGMVVFNDKKIPCWTYETEEERETLYIYLSGALYWKIHTSI